MEKSLEVIGQLQVEKQNTVRKVYAVKNLDEVYRRQTELNAMGISIYTDVATRLLPALEEDGAGREVWADISKKLKKLSFTGIPPHQRSGQSIGMQLTLLCLVHHIKIMRWSQGTRMDIFQILCPKHRLTSEKNHSPDFLFFLQPRELLYRLF